MNRTANNPKIAMENQSQSTVWDYKPWWCQPWSILLTGVSIITGSWLLFHRYWLTALVSLPILAWMSFFLLLYPRLVAETSGLDEAVNLNPPDSLPKV